MIRAACHHSQHFGIADLVEILVEGANAKADGGGLGGDHLIRQTVQFGGTLDLTFSSNFSTLGSVKIFDFENYSGGFDNFSTTGLADGYSATFDSLSGTVNVVPEPSTYALLALAAAGLGAHVVRRRRSAR